MRLLRRKTVDERLKLILVKNLERTFGDDAARCAERLRVINVMTYSSYDGFQMTVELAADRKGLLS